MRKTRVLLAGLVTAFSFAIAAPAQAEQCHPDDGRVCCETTADKVNSVSRRLIGQDVLLCTQ